MANPNKAKGKRFEYECRDYFKSLGFNDCVLSGGESINADNMGIDLCNLPFIVQCKNGYARGLNYSDIIKKIEIKTKKTKYEGQVIFVFHKCNRKTTVSMNYKDYSSLFKLELKDVKYLLKDGNIITVDLDTFKKHFEWK